jgi:hypothetical protein
MRGFPLGSNLAQRGEPARTGPVNAGVGNTSASPAEPSGESQALGGKGIRIGLAEWMTKNQAFPIENPVAVSVAIWGLFSTFWSFGWLGG